MTLKELEAIGFNGRVIVVCPPIYSRYKQPSLTIVRFIRGKTAYAMSKYSASICVLGLGMDESIGYTICGLWPASALESAATKGVPRDMMRDPRIFGDAVLEIAKSSKEAIHGKLLIDQDFLEGRGYSDFSKYNLGDKDPPRMMPRVFPDLRVKEHHEVGFSVSSVRREVGTSKL